MPKGLTVETLLRRIQSALNEIRRTDPATTDEKEFKRRIDRARTIAYLASVASQLIEKHELAKRLDELEEKLTQLEERR